MSDRVRKMLAVLACAVAVIGLPSRARAQATGQIAGVVSDSSGSVVPGATVEVTNQATGFTRNAVSGVDGVYTIPLLNPGRYDVKANINGGGQTGQSGALRLAVARALVKIDETHRRKLRDLGLLTRDARAVERKKPGRPKARKRFQFSKR